MYEELYKEAETSAAAVERLAAILQVLRGEQGCPWDRKQTHETLRVCMVEEAYETVEAIERKNWDNLEEELGDMLLQVLFHAGLGEESGRFDLKTLANRECEKMISRHPYIFEKNCEKYGIAGTESVDKALEKWENVKDREQVGLMWERMERIPRALPALNRAYKVQAKAARVGFDWNSVDGAFAKVEEESRELRECMNTADAQHVLEEVGDLLFAAVNVARFLEVDPEDALNFTSQKFMNRFRYVEESARKAGRNLSDMKLEEMDLLWERAKAEERAIPPEVEDK